MSGDKAMIIDLYAHIMPPKYKKYLEQATNLNYYLRDVVETLPTLWDLERRFRILDKFPDLVQVMVPSLPDLESLRDPQKALELATRLNDEVAEILRKYPDRFAAGVAAIPLLDIGRALDEIDRSLLSLKLRGILLHIPVNENPIDREEYMPVFAKMYHYDLPIFLHPARKPSTPDYRSEKRSKYMLFHIFGWPYETACAMLRLIFCGIFDRFPGIKIITHHCGGFVPYLWDRIIGAYDHADSLRKAGYAAHLKGRIEDYLRMYYYDTALYGNSSALMGAYKHCGAHRMVFATDFPFDNELGERYIRQTLYAVNEMPISQDEKKLILEGNAKRILNLPS